MMIRRLADYGLKEFYDFMEIQVPATYDIPDIHDRIINHISPAIIELEASGLIDSFHFILNKDIALRLSTEDWSKNEKKIKEIRVLAEFVSW